MMRGTLVRGYTEDATVRQEIYELKNAVREDICRYVLGVTEEDARKKGRWTRLIRCGDAQKE